MGYSATTLNQIREAMNQLLPKGISDTAIHEISKISTNGALSSFGTVRQINQEVHFEFAWLFSNSIIDLTVNTEVHVSLIPLNKIIYLTKKITGGKVLLEIWTGLPAPTVIYEASTESAKPLLISFHESLVLQLKQEPT